MTRYYPLMPRTPRADRNFVPWGEIHEAAMDDGVALFALVAGTFATSLEAVSTYASAAFQVQWQQGETITLNFWGPLATAKDSQQEDYKDAPGGKRTVQYFDKGRMELGANNAVTSGLLATELVKGQVQVGDAAYVVKVALTIPIAGDPDNIGPTYAALGEKAASLLAPVSSQVGSGDGAFRVIAWLTPSTLPGPYPLFTAMLDTLVLRG